MKGRRLGMIGGLVLLAVLVVAWIDGGAEPLRPIEQDVPLPESVR